MGRRCKAHEIYVDEFGRFKDDVYFDVITRQFVDKDEKTEGGIPAAKMHIFMTRETATKYRLQGMRLYTLTSQCDSKAIWSVADYGSF